MKLKSLIPAALLLFGLVAAADQGALKVKSGDERLPLAGDGVRAGFAGEKPLVVQGARAELRSGHTWRALELKFAPDLLVSAPDSAFLAGEGNLVRVFPDGRQQAMPPLPAGIRPGAGTVFENKLWLLDGKLYVLPLTGSAQWQTIDADFPRDLRGAAMAGRFGELLVIGGKTAQGVSSRITGWRAKPVDGTARTGWRELSALPYPLANAGIHATGQNHLAIFGGERADGKLSDEILIFHLPTESIYVDGKLPAPAAHPAGNGKLLLAPTSGAIHTMVLERVVRSLNYFDYGMIALYFAGIALVGFYFARKKTNSEEFMVGNRNTKWWAAAISMFATGASSISFMAIPAQTFHSNLVWFFPNLLMIPLYFVGAYWIFPMLINLKLTSTYEYMERRFHPSIRYIASLQCILFEVFGRMSVVLLLPSLAISAVTGLNVTTSILLMGVLTTAYTMLGGFEAVIWTDVAQGVLMLIGGLLMILLAIDGLPGGAEEFLSTCRTFHKFDFAIWDLNYTLPIFWFFLLAAFINCVNTSSNQSMAQRVFATPMKDVRKFNKMFIFCGVFISLLVNVAGLAIFCWFRANPHAMYPDMSNDQIVPIFLVQRFPAGLAGLLIAAIFAASMSTLSSSMNSVATIFTTDFYGKFRPLASDTQRVRVLQIVSLLVGVIGIALALIMGQFDIRSMFEVWNVIGALIGGGFGGMYILGIMTRRTNWIGAWAGAAASIVVTVYLQTFTNSHWTLLAPAAVLSCMVVGYLVSLLVPTAPKDLTGLTLYSARKEEK